MGEDTNRIAEAFNQLAELAHALGATPLNKHPGCWTHTFGKWEIKVNAHREELEKVPPFHALVSWQGMPALLLWPSGGITIGAGDPEGDFIIACNAEIERVREMPAVTS
jgi:hypothetical protein